MYRVVFLFVALYMIDFIGRSGPITTASAVLDKESYAFYSSLYGNSKSLAPEEAIAIAAKPLPFPAKSSCLLPSTEEERKMVELAQAMPPQREWKRQFDFGRPYFVIPPDETNKAINCISPHHGQSPMSGCELYIQMRFVRFLSVPVFNSDHTRALIAISRACGGLCGNGATQVYRRTHDGWKLESGSFAKCIWIS